MLNNARNTWQSGFAVSASFPLIPYREVLSADFTPQKTCTSREALSEETLDTVGASLAIDTRPPAHLLDTLAHDTTRPTYTTDHGIRLAPLDGCAKVLLNGRPATTTVEPADHVGTAGSPATTWP